MASKINTSKYEDVITNVLIDDREGERIEYALQQYSNFNPLKCHLEYGDYIFVGHNGTRVVFEYKTGNDFLNSINSENNHLHNQVHEMITNEEYTFVIVECADMLHELDQLYYSSGVSISLQQIDGFIAECCTVSTLIQTQTRYQAFDMMMRIASKIILDKPYRYKYGKKSTNQALNWLSGMKGLDDTAETICRTLDLHTLEDILNLTKEDLIEVNGVGVKTAEKILKNIRRSRN